MATSENPFLALKARLVLLIFLAISLTMALVFSILGALELMPLQGGDPILAPILYSLVFSGLCLSIVAAARRSPIHLAALFGPWPRQLAWVQLLWLVVGVVLLLVQESIRQKDMMCWWQRRSPNQRAIPS
jgi:hypothetical protein